MATPRKTISVALLLFQHNFRNTHFKQAREQRIATNGVMEEVLHSTGNYAGFNYLMPAEVPPGCAPGINRVDLTTASMEEKFDGTDDTRVVYYVSATLRAEYAALNEIQEKYMAKCRDDGDLQGCQYLSRDLK